MHLLFSLHHILFFSRAFNAFSLGLTIFFNFFFSYQMLRIIIILISVIHLFCICYKKKKYFDKIHTNKNKTINIEFTSFGHDDEIDDIVSPVELPVYAPPSVSYLPHGVSFEQNFQQIPHGQYGPPLHPPLTITNYVSTDRKGN